MSKLSDEGAIGCGSRAVSFGDANVNRHARREPGSAIGTPSRHWGHSASSYDTIGRSSSTWTWGEVSLLSP